MSEKLNPKSIGVAVITHCSKDHLPHCLPPILRSKLSPKVLVTNSSSNDGTVELAEELGAETLVIPRSSFNHGSTRELARQKLGTDIVIMMTPDAYLKDENSFNHLVQPILEGRAAVSYARQLPKKDAGFFGSFLREFNYGANSHIRTIKDLKQYGVYTYFCSDSCSAYDSHKLDQIGGFPPVLIGEDTVAAAKLLHLGEAIAYVAEAEVYHSHDYNLTQEFQRHFDTGIARESYRPLLHGAADSKRGKEYVKALFKKVLKEKPHLFPYAVIQTGVKYLGYTLGKYSHSFPHQVKKAFSGQKYYWGEE